MPNPIRRIAAIVLHGRIFGSGAQISAARTNKIIPCVFESSQFAILCSQELKKFED